MSKIGETSNQTRTGEAEPAIRNVDGRLIIHGGLIHLANSGVVEAQLMLAKIHRDPHPQLHDMEKALRWLRAAAERGHTGAQLELGEIHQQSGSIYHDPEKATLYYCDAGLEGNSEGAYRLGMMFYLGKEITRDWVNAYAWLKLAVDLGRREVKQTLTNIKKALSRIDRSEAETLLTKLKNMRGGDDGP